MFILDAYFSESSLNSVDLFTQLLLSTPFPQKKFRIRPDNAKGFLNLKRAINAVNLKHSTPDGFYMESDFSRIHAPKDKAHLESSHRSLHNFEIRIIKAFENRIKKTIPGFIFSDGKKQKITVTCLDISLHDLKTSSLMEEYRHEHNSTRHYFSEEGKVSAWIPDKKLDRKPFEKSIQLSAAPEANELDQIITFLEHNSMVVDRLSLIETFHKGLSLDLTQQIFNHNKKRYIAYAKKMRQPDDRKGLALFNAFILDCQNHQRKTHVAPYATHGEI